MSNLNYLAVLPLLLLAPACDNVGRAFGSGGAGTDPGTETNIQRMVEQGLVVAGRPKVRNVFPEGSGWPGTVPIVVEFSESVNEASVAPSGGTPSLQIRIKGGGGAGGIGGGAGGIGGVGGDGSDPGGGGGGGSTTVPPIPASYDFLLGGRVVVIRPTAPFDTTQIQEYEIVVTSELRDADGVRFANSGEKVIGSFTPDQDAQIVDGEILTVIPVDNARDQLRESSVYVIFTKPAAQASVTTGTAGSFKVQAGGTVLDGAVSFPVRAAGVGGGNVDGRIAEFIPAAIFDAASTLEIVVNNSITFGTTGKLEFRNRSPFAKFTTHAPEAVIGVSIGNSPAGTTDKVSQANIDTVLVDVNVPASTLLGDRIDVRIYGLDKKGGTSQAVSFVEASATTTTAGAQTVTVDLAGKLGTASAPQFLEGALTLAASLTRGARVTGFVLADSTNEPTLDVTGPQLTFPTVDAQGGVVYYTDQEYLTFNGTSNEVLGAVTLVLASSPAPAPASTTGVVFGFGAAGSGGKFMFDPILLGRRTTPLGFTLTISDPSGNLAPAINGTIVQRGVVTGSVASGTLTVEAYDDATFAPIAGATVLVAPGLPTTAAVGRTTAILDASGRATFTGLTAASYTVTLIKAGYDLITLLDSPAGYMSLPMRPMTNATATIDGTVAFAATQGARVLVGSNIIDDVRNQAITTSSSAPTAIPATQVRPNRPYTLTAFSGAFEPTSKPGYTNFACSFCGVTGILKEALRIPIQPGENGGQSLALLPVTVTAVNLAATYDKDLSTWTGLDTAKLVGNPTVRVMASFWGMPGMTLVGVGFSKLKTGTTYEIDGAFSGSIGVAATTFGPKFWVSTEAVDSSGNLARHRRIVGNLVTGVTLEPFVVIPKIPTITLPGSASAGSPTVTYQDRLDPTSIPGGFGFQILTATDAAGRQWRMIQQDTTSATVAVTRQFPVMTGVTAVGLATGTWRMFAESVLVFSPTFGTGDYVLEEIRREEVSYARAATKNFTVN